MGGMIKRSKYGNVKKNGFDSKKESKRYTQLLLMEKAGEISDIQTQVKFELIPSQKKDGKVIERPCSYIADFVYQDKSGNTIVEDVKGFRKIPEYIIKRKLMLFIYGIKISEV
jgi:hypothetical protein